MPGKTSFSLELHKCDCTEGDQPLDWCRSAALREQLVAEIAALEAQLESLESSVEELDFGRQQACREMIRARAAMFRQLRR